MSAPYWDDPCGLDESDRLLARLDTEHRLGLHADPHGDCPACSSEAAGLEGQRDPVTAHVERRLVDPWLVSGEQFRDLALGGELHGAGGLQGDLVSLRHGHKVDERENTEQGNSLAGGAR